MMNTAIILVIGSLLAACSGMAGTLTPADARSATPAAPDHLEARVVTKEIRLTWAPGKGASPETFEVVRGDFPGGPFTIICAVGGATTSCVDRAAEPEHIYFYRVRARSTSHASPWSREATVEIPGIVR